MLSFAAKLCRYGLVNSLDQGLQITEEQFFVLNKVVREMEIEDQIRQQNAIALALGAGKDGGGEN